MPSWALAASVAAGLAWRGLAIREGHGSGEHLDLGAGAVADQDCTCPAKQDRFARDDCIDFLRMHESRDWRMEVREAACQRAGCCWQPLEHHSAEPWCFVKPLCCQDGVSYGFDPEGHCRATEGGKRAATECCRRQQEQKTIEDTASAEEENVKAAALSEALEKETEEVQEIEASTDALRTEMQGKRAEVLKEMAGLEEVTAESAAALEQKMKEALKDAVEQEQRRADELLEKERARLELERQQEELRLAEEQRLRAAEAERKAAEALEEKKRHEQALAQKAALEARQKEEERQRLAEERRLAEEAALQAELLRKTAPGTLTVKVLNAENLPDSDTMWFQTKADAFVRVGVKEGEEQLTPHVHNSASPSWNRDFSFEVDAQSSVVRLEVFDYDLIADEQRWGGWAAKKLGFDFTHDRLGTVAVDFRALDADKEVAFEEHLPTAKDAALVRFTLKWQPRVGS